MFMRNMLIFVVALLSAGMADQISGKVSSVEDNTVVIAGVKVDISSATVYNRKGQVSKASEIKEGAGIEVVGEFDANGKIIAKEVTLQKKIKTAVIEGTVTEVNGVVKFIMINSVKIQAADGGKVTNDLGHELAIEMIEPGATVLCKGTWNADLRFYAKHIQQEKAATAEEAPVSVEPAVVTEETVEKTSEEVVEEPAM